MPAARTMRRVSRTASLTHDPTVGGDDQHPVSDRSAEVDVRGKRVEAEADAVEAADDTGVAVGVEPGGGGDHDRPLKAVPAEH